MGIKENHQFVVVPVVLLPKAGGFFASLIADLAKFGNFFPFSVLLDVVAVGLGQIYRLGHHRGFDSKQAFGVLLVEVSRSLNNPVQVVCTQVRFLLSQNETPSSPESLIRPRA